MIDRIKFSTADLNYSIDPDCVLPPDDPIYTGLDHSVAKMSLPAIATNNKAQHQRENNVRPGTDAWFKLWFGGAR
jgi:hypothetical protein